MYAFLDLKTRLFLSQEPDEKDNVQQREYLIKQISRLHKTKHPEAVVSLIHIDDASDNVDWHAPNIVGPKGSEAVFSADDATPYADNVSAIREATKDHKRKLQDLQNKFTSDCAALNNEYERVLITLLKRKQRKSNGPKLVQAGYDRDGKWREADERVS